jgi:magnesium transporter
MLTIYDVAGTGTGLVARADTRAVDANSVWIDLLNPTPEEDAAMEAALGISIPTRAEMREIEASNRLYVENGALFMTAFVIYAIEQAVPRSSAITFILAGHRLVTVRYAEPRAFPMFLSRAEKGDTACTSALDILLGLIEQLVHRQADLIERIQDDVDRLAPAIFDIKGGQQTRGKRLDVTLRTIGKEGDIVARVQESAFSLNRMLAFLTGALREKGSETRAAKRIKSVQRDIESLLDNMRFLSARVDFLLDATLGMISIEQNQIIKLFSVAAVVFLPPTLIASIYGMNFKHMPELEWTVGYPLAVLLMVLAAVLPYLFFRRKGWL